MSAVTILQLVAVMLFWAACFPLITSGIEYAPHLTFATLRAGLAGITLVIFAVAMNRPAPRGVRVWLLLTGVGLGATSLGFLGMFHAAEFVSPGIATVIANTQPILAAGLASSFLGERLGPRGKVGMGLAFSGIVVIALPELLFGSGKSYAVGVAYILLAALGITVSNVLIKKISTDVDALMAMGIQMLIGAVPLGIAAWAMEDSGDIQWSLEFLAVLITLSLAGTALAYWLWFTALKKVSLNRANAFSFLVPIFGLAAGTAFYQEVLSFPEVVGIALVVAGIGLIIRPGLRE